MLSICPAECINTRYNLILHGLGITVYKRQADTHGRGMITMRPVLRNNVVHTIGGLYWWTLLLGTVTKKALGCFTD